MKATTARVLLTPLTTFRALRRMRTDLDLAFEDAWIRARLEHHPEEYLMFLNARQPHSAARSAS